MSRESLPNPHAVNCMNSFPEKAVTAIPAGLPWMSLQNRNHLHPFSIHSDNTCSRLINSAKSLKSCAGPEVDHAAPESCAERLETVAEHEEMSTRVDLSLRGNIPAVFPIYIATKLLLTPWLYVWDNPYAIRPPTQHIC